MTHPGATRGVSGATPGVSGASPGESGATRGVSGASPGASGAIRGVSGASPRSPELPTGCLGLAPRVPGLHPGCPGLAPGCPAHPQHLHCNPEGPVQLFGFQARVSLLLGAARERQRHAAVTSATESTRPLLSQCPLCCSFLTTLHISPRHCTDLASIVLHPPDQKGHGPGAGSVDAQPIPPFVCRSFATFALPLNPFCLEPSRVGRGPVPLAAMQQLCCSGLAEHPSGNHKGSKRPVHSHQIVAGVIIHSRIHSQSRVF